MSIIAWIILGLGAGLLANLAAPGDRQQRLILTCMIGIAGALLGGWGATTIFHVHSFNGFFNASTWPTAVTGAAVLLLAYHLLTSSPAGRGLAGPGLAGPGLAGPGLAGPGLAGPRSWRKRYTHR